MNLAETQFSVLASACLKGRNPSEEPLSRNISIYETERNAAASVGNGRFIAENARAKLRLLYPDTSALTQYQTSRSPATAWGTVLPFAPVPLSLTVKDSNHGNLHREDDFRFHTSVQRWTDDIP